jgi:hypothetical protein
MADNVLTYLDSYCERAGEAGAWGEPINLITNFFFIMAAIAVGRALLRQSPSGKTLDLWLLTATLFAIGVGSGLWHWRPSQATLLMDVIPITLFMNIYLLSALRRLFNLSWGGVVAWWLVYVGVTLVGQKTLPADMLHGTVMYLPTYATMLALAVGLVRKNAALGKAFWLITAVWTLSLIFRTIDLDICASLWVGTHFLWHTLNAWVLWRLLMLLVERK